MSRQEELEGAIAKVIVATADKLDRLPTPKELSEEIVLFLYGVADHDKEIDEKKIIV